MLAERSVRHLSIRAPDDALARRAGFLIEDALRTASLPGDGAGLLLVRRLRLPPFSAGASPQQVALRLEAQCRAAVIVEGAAADDAALAAASAVRFADALSAHLALTRLILAGAPGRAWCWPLAVKGYRAALDRGAALRAVALSLADLPEAPAALAHWLAQLVEHGTAACVAFLLAIEGGDLRRLVQATGASPVRRTSVTWEHWPTVLEWSAQHLGPADGRHLWLLAMARACGVQVDARAALAPELAAADPPGGLTADVASDLQPGGASSPDAVVGVDPVSLPTGPAEPARRAPQSLSASAPDQPLEASAPLQVAPGTTAPHGEPTPVKATAPSDEPGAEPAGALDRAAVVRAITASTSAGGLLYLVPLLARLGLGEAMAEAATPRDLPQRIFATLLARLPIDGDDPAWLLCDLPLRHDPQARREALRWLGACRRQLRLKLGIGLHSLVCRPAAIAITPTHLDVRQPIDAVDLRIRRAGLDIDPGWVPWLGRVLRFHYGRDDA